MAKSEVLMHQVYNPNCKQYKAEKSSVIRNGLQVAKLIRTWEFCYSSWFRGLGLVQL